MEEDFDGLEAVGDWIVNTIGIVVENAIQVGEWIDSWPLSFKLIGGGAIVVLIFMRLAKR